MTIPDAAGTDASRWMRDVVEPIASRIAAHGVEPAGAAPRAVNDAPIANEVQTARGIAGFAAGAGGAIVRLVGSVVGDVLKAANLGLRPAPPAAPTALALGSVVSGGTITGRVSVGNGTDGPYNAVQLVARGFVAPRGGHIPPPAIRFSPDVFDVPGRSATVVAIEVDVPARVPAGNYIGVVEVAGRPGAAIVVTLDVL